MTELRALTSLRGFAALYVVLLHFSATAQLHCAVKIPSLAPRGHLAVDFFFVLSGFIMGYNYVASFEAVGLRAFPTFLARRVARIVPLNTAVIIGMVVLAALSVALIGRNIFPAVRLNSLPTDMLANLFMLQGLGVAHNMNGPSWSISIEFAAYLVFPVFVYTIFHKRLIVCLVALALSVVGLYGTVREGLYLWSPSPYLDTVWTVVRCFAEFAMGMAVYRLYASRCLARLWGSDTLVIGIVVCTGTIVVLRLGDLFAVLLFPVLLICFAYNMGWPARLIGARFPYFLGVVSYSIYLIHDTFRPIELELLRALHPQPLGAVGALAFAAVGTMSVLLPAWLSYLAIERPGRSVVRQLFARLTPAQPPSRMARAPDGPSGAR